MRSIPLVQIRIGLNNNNIRYVIGEMRVVQIQFKITSSIRTLVNERKRLRDILY